MMKRFCKLAAIVSCLLLGLAVPLMAQEKPLPKIELRCESVDSPPVLDWWRGLAPPLLRYTLTNRTDEVVEFPVGRSETAAQVWLVRWHSSLGRREQVRPRPLL
ncbi:MAG TPA: hypothetical protein VGB77_23115, partial [Abditibacteriaceae bacterium]